MGFISILDRKQKKKTKSSEKNVQNSTILMVCGFIWMITSIVWFGD